MIIQIHESNNQIHTGKIKRQKKIITISDALLPGCIVCCSVRYAYMLRVYACVFYSITLLFAYLCMRMTSTPRSIAGVPSGRTSGLPYYYAPLVCVPDVMGGLLAAQQTQNQQPRPLPT